MFLSDMSSATYILPYAAEWSHWWCEGNELGHGGPAMTHRKHESIRAALYLRVSTDEQHAENQLPELERFAEAHGWEIANRYVDQGESGAKASRPAIDRLLADARRGRFNVVLCWSISRFGRSMVNAVLAMHELTELGIRLVALQQAVDTGTVVGRGVAALLAALAEAELEEKRERVKAGIRRVRARGQRFASLQARALVRSPSISGSPRRRFTGSSPKPVPQTLPCPRRSWATTLAADQPRGPFHRLWSLERRLCHVEPAHSRLAKS